MTVVLLVPVILFVFGGGVYIGMCLVSGRIEENQIISTPMTYPATTAGSIGKSGLRGTLSLQNYADISHNTAVSSITAMPLTYSANIPAATRETLMPPHADVVADRMYFAMDKITEFDFRCSLHVDAVSHFAASNSMDSEQLVVGSWVRLDLLPVDDNMRTIFSNKKPGCDRDSSRNGVAMYVNDWKTGNQVLYVEYGSAVSGCEKVSSGSVLLVPNTWYHVAVSFLSGSVALYINGNEVGRRESSFHQVQTKNPMFVGHFDASGSFALFGNISNFAVVHGETSEFLDSPGIVKEMMNPSKVERIDYMYSLFKFKEASAEDPDVAPIDTFRKTTGAFKFQRRGRMIIGLNIPLRDGTSPFTEDDIAVSDRLARQRRQSIKDGMVHSWTGYKTYAWGSDELKPASRRGSDPWGGIGCTLVDALDTLWVMDMKTEFYEAVEWVKKSLSFDHVGTVSTFETTIRALGGLLSAYDLSREVVLLQKAEDLGDRLLKAFTTRSGIPMGAVSLNSGSGAPVNRGGSAVLSELGTLQVEFRYLAEATKRPEFEAKAMKALQVMRTKRPGHGLYPIKVSLSDGSFVDRHVTFGALGDSFYEYLLKVWIQGGQKEMWLRDMYDESVNGVVDVLLKVTKKTGLAYISDWDGRNNIHKMDHLVCFMPGLLALGSVTDPKGKDSPRAKRDMAIAKALMFTCRYKVAAVL